MVSPKDFTVTGNTLRMSVAIPMIASQRQKTREKTVAYIFPGSKKTGGFDAFGSTKG